MELQIPTFPLLFTFLFVLVMVIKRGNKPKPENPDAKLPPSPWKLPIIGNLLHFIGGALPHRVLHLLSRKHGPIMLLKLGQVDHIVISSPEAAKEIMKIHDLNFASRPELIAIKIMSYGNRDILCSPYGSYWKQIRKICVLELLSARRVKGFRPIREEENSNLTKQISMSNKSPVNLTEKLLLLTNTTTSRVAFGAECKHASRFISEIKKQMELSSGFNLVDLFPSSSFVGTLTGVTAKLETIHQKMDEILDEIVTEHQAKKGPKRTTSQDGEGVEEDLLDVLLRLKEEGELEIPLTITDIKAVILDMFIGGTEPSAVVLEWAMAELMRHPGVMKKVQAEVRSAATGKAGVDEGDIEEMPYMKLVIKETLRLHPPAPLLFPRVCSETCVVRGLEIPAGSRVIINAWAIARDPRYWEDAETFRPERFDGSSVDFKGGSFEYLPFGGGRRVCPGMAFGMASMELALAQLLFHFDWDLPHGMKQKELDMTESFGAATARKSALYLIATPHVPLPAA